MPPAINSPAPINQEPNPRSISYVSSYITGKKNHSISKKSHSIEQKNSFHKQKKSFHKQKNSFQKLTEYKSMSKRVRLGHCQDLFWSRFMATLASSHNATNWLPVPGQEVTKMGSTSGSLEKLVDFWHCAWTFHREQHVWVMVFNLMSTRALIELCGSKLPERVLE